MVADPGPIRELLDALAEPLPTAAAPRIDVVPSSGGDDTIDLFEARKPHVVVVTATLDAGDTAALVSALRDLVPRAEVGVVVVGDADGPIRAERDAAELAPDRFVARPLEARALRFAVASTLEAVLLVRREVTASGTGTAPGTDPAHEAHRPPPAAAAAVDLVDLDPAEAVRAAQRARWEALADSIIQDAEAVESDDPDVALAEPIPLPPPVTILPRRAEPSRPPMPVVPPPPAAWREPAAPAREPTLILRDPPEPAPAMPAIADEDMLTSRTEARDAPPPSRTRTGDDHVDLAERSPGAAWSEPMPLAELVDRDSRRELDEAAVDVEELDDLDEPPVRISDPYLGSAADLAALVGGRAPAWPGASQPAPDAAELVDDADDAPPAGDGRDFARQLRAKMSVMAQRLFQGADAAAPAPVDLAPRHDHHTEIDLASLGEDLPLGGGVTEIEPRVAQRAGDVRDHATSPGSWDTQVRERGLPEAGELMRGVSDAPCLLAKMFAGGLTGRVAFRRDAVEKVVHFDSGRPVFASSNEPGDRMGELLVREGKITASQYERCQAVVAQSGRRMGEILVDFGYLKRRELLPAVRRHVEDIVYSTFGWDRGAYQITIDPDPCGERIRLSRHPAALVLEGIRRKLDRSTLDRLLGPASTVIEVSDRERLGAVINTGDLAPEERAALAAFDGQADLAHVARTAGIDVADILPLAWGLCVLGLANARRADTEVPDESTALVGETDLAIDRERVRARWQLVTEADYFALLGVRRDATGFEIRRAYQSARRDFAIESFPSDLRRELAQELDDIQHVLEEAFRVLRDDHLRTRYLENLIE